MCHIKNSLITAKHQIEVKILALEYIDTFIDKLSHSLISECYPLRTVTANCHHNCQQLWLEVACQLLHPSYFEGDNSSRFTVLNATDIFEIFEHLKTLRQSTISHVTWPYISYNACNWNFLVPYNYDMKTIWTVSFGAVSS